MTEWKSIIGYENEYLVSNNGDVFSLRSKKRLKPSINEKGYMRVCLQKRGMKSWKRVNRLVAEAFIPNPEDKPTVNHKNGIRDDNHVWNLEWATVLEQNSDPMRVKNMSKSMMRSEYVLRKKRKVLQFDSDGYIYAIHEGLHDAARSVGTTAGNIFLCCNGQRKTCKGFKFQYTSDRPVCDAGDCGGAERRRWLMTRMDVREKLAEIVKKAAYSSLPSNTEDFHLNMFVTNLLSHGVTVQEWIPAEYPPKEYRDEYGELIPFLVCEEGTDYPFRAMYDGKTWGDGIFAITVKWWMHLPAPPKEKERKDGDDHA